MFKIDFVGCNKAGMTPGRSDDEPDCRPQIHSKPRDIRRVLHGTRILQTPANELAKMAGGNGENGDAIACLIVELTKA